MTEWFADRGREHQQAGEGGYPRADGASSAEIAGLATFRTIGDDYERRWHLRRKPVAIRLRALRGGSLQISLVASRWSRGETGETPRSWSSEDKPARKFLGNYRVDIAISVMRASAGWEYAIGPKFQGIHLVYPKFVRETICAAFNTQNETFNMRFWAQYYIA